MSKTSRSFLLPNVFSLAAAGWVSAAPVPDQPRYNRDVRPILADACFNCHGFDKNARKADLRLDVRDAALAERDGVRAIVPGDVVKSALVGRLHQKDPDEVMPPPDSARQLTDREKQVLERWIAQGAVYEDHWAYLPMVKPAPPQATAPGFSKTPVDAFILDRLKEQGLQPAAEADKATLVRRLYFDLLGLPPSNVEVDAFVNDGAADAVEKLVDKLLASPHFGERMAVWWLDLVRFADTIGYHSDNPMPVYPYRDYVIASFNQNKPFDRFTVEQVAGDLLPEASQETKIGSAYNRLLLTTEEGGAQPGQYVAKYLTDRVKSIGTTWLAQTYMCAECHDHKYDPITARDFYSLGAFFADVQENIVGKRDHMMAIRTPEQEKALADLNSRMAELEKDLAAETPERTAAYQKWEAEMQVLHGRNEQWKTIRFATRTAPTGTELVEDKEGAVFAKSKQQGEGTYALTATGLTGTLAALRIEALPHPKLPAQGPGRAGNGNFVITELIAKLKRADGSESQLKFASSVADHEQTSHNDGTPYSGWRAIAVIDGDAKGAQYGWAILPEVGKSHQLVLGLEQAVALATGDTLSLEILQNHGGGTGTHGLGHFRISFTENAKLLPDKAPPLPAALADIFRKPAAERSPDQLQQLKAHFRNLAPEMEAVRKALADTKKQRDDFEKSLPTVLTTVRTDKPRTVRVLPRGDWQNETGEVVSPGLPSYLPGARSSTAEKRLNRLDLAQWLVAKENPLTARVFVNRLWKQFHGIGLSKTLEDIGTQSEVPVHQPLLDWLACEFRDSGWDVKRLVKLLVTSGVYRQSSHASPEMIQKDPFNREHARGGRWRLDAEFVRDNALAVAGLLETQIGGPSVHPYQPGGYWENLNFPGREWPSSKDKNQWRRGLYTWWQRSTLHPYLVAFDAPSREECSADRIRSNIPQQALAGLNDPTFLEAARSLAARILKEGGTDATTRIAWAWKHTTSRPGNPEELAVLRNILEKHTAEFSNNKEAAAALLKTGQAPLPADVAVPELAAWTSVARVLLNLHETITRG